MTRLAEANLPETDALDRDDLIVAIECETKVSLATLDAAQLESQASETAARHFERQKPQRDALADNLIVTPFLPLPVVKHCLNVATRLAPYVDEMRNASSVVFERLELRERALSFWHADSRLAFATDNVSLERRLVDEGKPLRDAMLNDWGGAMVLWEVMTEKELQAVKKGQGHDDLAVDLAFLGKRCVDEWKKLDGRVTFTLADAKRALVVGTQLMEARAKPENAAAKDGELTAAEARNDHRRAFTLLMQSINEYRTGLAWLRRDDRDFDLDAVVPTPYSVRRPNKPKAAPKSEEAPAEPEETVPTV